MKLYAELRETGNKRTGGRLAYQSVANCHIALRRALADAVDAGIINRNPAAGALKLTTDPVEMKTWTPAGSDASSSVRTESASVRRSGWRP